ncbi:MAG: rubrerythrin family protein [archaeon]|nr:rubrerythrin family protein [archaeon]
MSIIVKNLKEAINGESNARRKYELFAEQAEKENLKDIAHLFRATAIAEGYHIKNHLKALSTVLNSEVDPKEFVNIDEKSLQNDVKDTKSNLISAISGELYEYKHMYKTFLKNTRKIGNDVVELSFQLARDAEKIHAKLYSKCLKKLEKGKVIEINEIYVCTICGNLELNELPNSCIICDHGQRFFEKV